MARKDWLGRKSAEADKALFRRKRTGGFGAIRMEKQTFWAAPLVIVAFHPDDRGAERPVPLRSGRTKSLRKSLLRLPGGAAGAVGDERMLRIRLEARRPLALAANTRDNPGVTTPNVKNSTLRPPSHRCAAANGLRALNFPCASRLVVCHV